MEYVNIDDAFATRMNLVGAQPIEMDMKQGNNNMIPHPQSNNPHVPNSKPMYNGNEQRTQQPPSVPPMTYVPNTQPIYPESVPNQSFLGSQSANANMVPYYSTPPVMGQYTPPVSQFSTGTLDHYPDVSGDNIQGFSDPGYFTSLGMKRKDIQKLVILSLMVTLGIAFHWVIVNYYETWLSSWGLSGRQEFLLRVSYPAAIIFVMWNLKAFGMQKS
jgi:hypothetical protein